MVKALNRVVAIGLFHALQMPDDKERTLHNKIIAVAANMGLSVTINYVNAKFLRSSQGARVPVGNYDGIAGIVLPQYSEFPTWEDALQSRLVALGEATEKVGGPVGNDNKVPKEINVEIDPDTGKPYTKAKLKKLKKEAEEAAKLAEKTDEVDVSETEQVTETEDENQVEKTEAELFEENLKKLEAGE